MPCVAAHAQETTPFGAYVFPDSGSTFTATGTNSINVVSGTGIDTLPASQSGSFTEIAVQAGGVLDATQVSTPVVVSGTVFGSGTFEGNFEIEGTDIPSGVRTLSGTATYDGTSQLLCGLVEATSTSTELDVAEVQADAAIITPGALLGIYVYSASSYNRAFWFQPQEWPVLTAPQVTGTFSPQVTAKASVGTVLPGTGQFSVVQTGTSISLQWVPTAFSAWLFSTFGQEAGVSGTGGATDAPDGDGIPNLLKYALGLTPGQNDTAGLPTVAVSGTEYSMTYTQPDSVKGVLYTVNWSTDLQTWSTAGVTTQTLNDDGTTKTIEATAPVQAFAVYLRLTVTDQANDTASTNGLGINFLGEEADELGVIGALDAADTDGILNLIKYALGLTPGKNDIAGLPTASVSGTQFSLTYTKPDGIQYVTYVVESSTDLKTWAASGTSQILTDDGTTQVIKATAVVPSFSDYLRLTSTDVAGDVVHTQPLGINVLGEVSGTTGVIGATDAADGDGVPNLLKRALGLVPGADDVAGLPTVSLSGTELSLTYTVADSATNVTTCIVQWSTDLKTWTAISGTAGTLADDGTNATLQASVPFGAVSEGFLRLMVTDQLNNTVLTEPVGFLQMTVPGVPLGTGTTVHQWVSTPLRRAAIHQGVIASVDTAQAITIENADWSEDLTSAPYVACFLTGSATGLSLPITANTTDQLTLDTSAILSVYNKNGSFSPPWSAGDSVAILPSDTIGSLFGSLSFPDTAQVLVISGSTVSVAGGPSQGVNPNDAVFVAHSGTAALNLAFVGTVPSTQSITVVPSTGIRAIGNPQFSTLNVAGLGLKSRWLAGSDPQTVDTLRFWTGEQWAVYYTPSLGVWERAGNLVGQAFGVPLPQLPAAGGLVIHRGTGAMPMLLVSPAPYQP